MNNNAAVSPVTKVASSMVGFKQTKHKATFVVGDNATYSSALENRVLNSTSRLEIELPSIYKRLVECSTQYFMRSMQRRSCNLNVYSTSSIK